LSTEPSAWPSFAKRRCTSSSQRSASSAEVSPGRAAVNTSMRLAAPCSLATARPSQPSARASPTPARSSSPSAMIRIRDCGDGAGVMGAVGTGTSWTGTGASTLAVARATGRTRDPRRCSGLEGPGEQILLLDLVRGVRPRGRGGGGRTRHHPQGAPHLDGEVHRHEAPGTLVLRLLLDPGQRGLRVAVQDGPQLFGGKRVELLDPHDRRVVRALLLAQGDEVTVDLAGR